jgi:xylulokinase
VPFWDEISNDCNKNYLGAQMSLLGLDIGTTGCKAIIFSPDGKILGQAAHEYSISTPRIGWAEQDAEQAFAFAKQSLRQAAAIAKTDPPTAMAISCQGEAVVPVNAQGRALRPCILGMDTRTTSENRQLEEWFGAEFLFTHTGMPMHTINTLPKLMWLQKNEPKTWASAHQFLLYEDFIIRKLCGKAFISHCLASRTQMYDLHAGGWMGDVLQKCLIDKKRLAQLAPKNGEIAVILPQIADDLGLPRGIKIFAGGHDQACAALGAGVIDAGKAMVSTGTAEVVEVVMKNPVLDAKLRASGISVYRHVVPNRFLAMTLNHSGGLSLRWFRDNFGQDEMQQATAGGSDAYDLLLRDAPSGPTDLFILPHFAGSGTPTLDPASRGAILGMTFSTRKSEVVKAILEGLTFELRQNLDLLRSSGISIDTLHAVGGGAKNANWLQMKADICHATIHRPRLTEAACLGAALLAGVGSGVYDDFPSALDQVFAIERTFSPEPTNSMRYETRYIIYQQIYPLLKPFFAQL